MFRCNSAPLPPYRRRTTLRNPSVFLHLLWTYRSYCTSDLDFHPGESKGCKDSCVILWQDRKHPCHWCVLLWHFEQNKGGSKPWQDLCLRERFQVHGCISVLWPSPTQTSSPPPLVDIHPDRRHMQGNHLVDLKTAERERERGGERKKENMDQIQQCCKKKKKSNKTKMINWPVQSSTTIQRWLLVSYHS